jgi:putative endonuclease
MAKLSKFIPMAAKSSRKIRAKFIRKGKFYVYIVECIGGTYYTGYTNDLDERIRLHNNGFGAQYLKGKLPVRLVYAKEYRYYKNALIGERRIKKLTRVQKEELIKIYGKNNAVV